MTTPLKILQVVESASAGVGRHVLDLTSALLDRQHEVHLLYSPGRTDATFRGRLNMLRSHSLFRASEVSMHRGLHWTDLAAIAKIRRYALRYGPFDAAHFHSSKAGLVGRLALARSGIRRVYTPNALFTLGNRGVMRGAAIICERLLARLCETIILVSCAEFDHAVSIGLPVARLCVIHPGVCVDAPAGEKVPGRDVRIGFVGRLVEQKSPETLLFAFQILSKTMKRKARLRIVGDGPMLPKLKGLARNLGIADRIDWLGSANGAEEMKSFDIFALTSHYEGFPYVILEAMSSGVPIVATRVGGATEAIRDGENGFLAAPGDVEGIAKALVILVDDARLRTSMGAESRRLVRQFPLDRMIDQTVGAYCTGLRAPTASPLSTAAVDWNTNVRG